MHNSSKNILNFKYKIPLGIFVLAIGLFFAIHLIFVKADVATFYPTSCLGGWTNPSNAEGEPNVADGNTITFDKDNSAVLAENTVSNIFCGGFKGDIPKDTYAKKMILTFSWDTEKNIPAVPTDALSIPTTDINPEIIEVPSTSPDANIPDVEAPVENIPAQPAQEMPSDTVPVPETPVSFLNLFTSKAEASDEFLEVLYTIDGTNWKSLGTVDEAHLHFSVFEIPLPENAKWSDMSNIQINIKSLDTIDHTPSVYLDGMSLQITYGEISDIEPTTDSGLYMTTALSDSKDFNLNIRNSDKIDELVISGTAPLGNIAIFNTSTSAVVLTTFVEDSKYIIQPEYFGEGKYVFILTKDPNSCSDLTLEACRASSLYTGEGQFSVSSNDVGKSVTSEIPVETSNHNTATPVSE